MTEASTHQSALVILFVVVPNNNNFAATLAYSSTLCTICSSRSTHVLLNQLKYTTHTYVYMNINRMNSRSNKELTILVLQLENSSRLLVASIGVQIDAFLYPWNADTQQPIDLNVLLRTSGANFDRTLYPN